MVAWAEQTSMAVVLVLQAAQSSVDTVGSLQHWLCLPISKLRKEGAS